jgi:hypothetical protein
VGSNDSDGLTRIAGSYEALIQSIRSKLEGADRTAVDITIEHIRTQLPNGALLQRPTRAMISCRPRQPSYQGNASDVEFLNTIRGFILEQDAADVECESPSHSYDQTDQTILVPTFERPIRFPKKKLAIGYLDVYFSTIHIAYPYLHRPTTMVHFTNILKGEANESDECPWLGLLSKCFICWI